MYPASPPEVGPHIGRVTYLRQVLPQTAPQPHHRPSERSEQRQAPGRSPAYLSVFFPPCSNVMSWTTLPSVLASRANDVNIIGGRNFWRVIALA